MIRNIPSLSSDCQEQLKLALYYLNLAYDVDVIRYASPDSDRLLVIPYVIGIL